MGLRWNCGQGWAASLASLVRRCVALPSCFANPFPQPEMPFATRSSFVHPRTGPLRTGLLAGRRRRESTGRRNGAFKATQQQAQTAPPRRRSKICSTAVSFLQKEERTPRRNGRAAHTLLDPLVTARSRLFLVPNKSPKLEEHYSRSPLVTLRSPTQLLVSLCSAAHITALPLASTPPCLPSILLRPQL